MSELVSFEHRDGGSSGYRVERRDNLTLIFGSLPIDDLVALTKKERKGSVASPELAERMGATFAFGSIAAVDAALLTAPLRPVDVARADELGLSSGARQWLASGQHGESSRCLFSTLSGYALNHHGDTPADVSDLWRCRMMFDAAPELLPMIDKMRGLGREWTAVCEGWAELCETMDREAPNWRTDRNFKAPETCKRMAQLRARGNA